LDDIKHYLAGIAWDFGIPKDYLYFNWASYEGAKEMREQIGYALNDVVTNRLAQAAIAAKMHIILQRQWEKALRDPTTYRELYHYLTYVRKDV